MGQQRRSGIPAITGEIDESKAIHIFPEFLSPYRSTVIAYVTSFISTSIGFPFDTVKTRMQAYNKFSSVLDCVRSTYRHDGVRGFYRGVWAPIFSTAYVRSLSVGIFTGIKPTCYDLLYGRSGGDDTTHPFIRNFPVCFTAGAFAGIGTSIVSCPFEFTKVYSQIATLAQKLPLAAQQAVPKASTIDIVKTIVKHNGFRGLYSGYKYHVARDALGSGTYFAVYESFKWACNSLINGDPAVSSPVSILAAGGMSGVTCWAIIFPLDTTKSLIQKDIVTNLWRKETGLEPLPPKDRRMVITRRLYRGLGVSMTRSFIVNMVFFSAYEFSMKHLV